MSQALAAQAATTPNNLPMAAVRPIAARLVGARGIGRGAARGVGRSRPRGGGGAYLRAHAASAAGGSAARSALMMLPRRVVVMARRQQRSIVDQLVSRGPKVENEVGDGQPVWTALGHEDPNHPFLRVDGKSPCSWRPVPTCPPARPTPAESSRSWSICWATLSSMLPSAVPCGSTSRRGNGMSSIRSRMKGPECHRVRWNGFLTSM
jgi:hypothetical protein